ncbi:MAG: hypothetical protein K1X78_07865 [Verrucomicrobiaceae bacterium]|nr:hypothetical protein [Verrucomicrobiaceae bacterium]
MSVEVLRQEITSLRSDERDQLLGYILHLKRLEEEPDHLARVTAVLDDESPDSWIPFDEVKRKVAELDRSEASGE